MKKSIAETLKLLAIPVAACIALLSPIIGHAQTPTLSVDASAGQHPISPYIYGMAFGPGIVYPDPALAAKIKLPMGRWGGDAATNYHPAFNSFNSGNDNYFLQGYNGAPNGGGPYTWADYYLVTYRPSIPATQMLETIPINPYLPSSAAQNCSYSAARYGVTWGSYSVSYPTPGFPSDVCSGNAVTSGGTTIPYNSTTSGNYMPNSTAITAAWIAHNISKFGNCASGGICFYQLDNEPNGWSNTHRDWQPSAAGYAAITADGEKYATAIKTADPTARVLGPSDFGGWGWVNESPTSDPAIVYYLKQFAAYDAANGTRSLDYLDEHYGVGFYNATTPQQDFDSVRDWWDPTYASPTSSGINGLWFAGYSAQNTALGLNNNNQIIPRMNAYINAYYPGLKPTISEIEVQHFTSAQFPAIKGSYCYGNGGAGSSLIDALVLADALGVWGYYNLQLVNMFDCIDTGSGESFSYLLYRNYDGAGGQFGNTSVSASSSNPSLMSVYGALRSSDGKMTVIVINKEATSYTTSLSISGFNATSTAATYTYSSANTGALVAGTANVAGGNTVDYTFPAYSATEFVLTPSSTSGAPAPPTNLNATVQ